MKILILLSLLFCGCAHTGTVVCYEPDIRECAYKQLGRHIWIWRIYKVDNHVYFVDYY